MKQVAKIDKLKKELLTLDPNKKYAFSDIYISSLSKDTIRQYLHRLEKDRAIKIVGRGEFKINPDKLETVKVFVYGSLKKGFDNHDVISKDIIKVRKVSTVGRFSMYEDDFGNYPYIVREKKYHIQGELIDVTKDTLKKLDEFEGAPDLYKREKIKVKNKHNQTFDAYAYIRDKVSVKTKGKKPIRIWEDNTDQKVSEYEKLLKGMMS